MTSKTERILIVDDEMIIAEDLRQRLQAMGYTVVGLVATGKEAIAVARREHPQLVLMDVLLYGPMDGIEAARIITDECDIPVLFITACGDQDTVNRAEQVHGSSMLVKPFEDRALVLGMELVLTRHLLERTVQPAAASSPALPRAEMFPPSDILPILWCDEKGNVQSASAAARALLGVAGSEPVDLAKLHLDPATGEDLPALIARVHGNDLVKCDGCLDTGKGSLRWFALTFLPGEGGGAAIFLEDTTERRAAAKNHEALFLISEAAHEVTGLDELFASIHHIINEVLPAENFYIALYDEQTTLLEFPYFKDVYDPKPVTRPLKNGLTEYILRTGKPALVTPQRFEELIKQGEVATIGASSLDWLGVPLHLEGKTFGVLAVQSYSEGTRYTESDMQFLSFVSRQVAMAIDRTRKAENLRHSETELRGVFNALDDVVLVLDYEGRYISVAPTNQDLLYQPAEFLTGKLLSEVFQKERAEFFMAKIADCLKGRKRLHFDYVMDIRGKNTWFNATMTPVGEDRVLLFARDITSRREMESSLHEAQEAKKGVFENALMGIAQRALDGRFTNINPALMKMYGYTDAGELLAELSRLEGQRYRNVSRRDELRTLLETNSPISNYESQVRRKDDSLMWISENYTLVKDAAGVPLYYIVMVDDVTARKQAERELRLLANTVACAQDCFILTDMAGNVLFVNDAFVATFGYGSEELIGKPSQLLVSDRMSEAELLKVFRPADGTWNGELVARRAHGTVFPADVWTSVVRDDLNNPVAYVTVVRDISERKRNEEMLKSNELRLRRITDTMLDMVVQLDNAGHCEYVSPSVEKIVGYRIEDLLGKHLLTLVHPADHKRVMATFSRMEREKSPAALEYRIRDAAGKWVWVESIVNPLCDEKGAVIGFVAGSVDITSRKATEDVVRLNEARLETLVTLNQMTESSLETIVRFALEEAVRLTRSDIGYLAFVDSTETAIVSSIWSQHAARLCDPSQLEAMSRPMIDRTMEARAPYICVTSAPGPSGRQGKFMNLPVPEGNKIVAVVGVGNKPEEYDASDARQLTLLMEGMWLLIQRKRSQEEIHKSLEEKDVLLKEVHHRVKNNLQIISSLLRLQFGHTEDAALASVLKESQNRIRSMALIHERLYRSGDLSRVDFGGYVSNLTSYLIRSYTGGERNVTVSVEIEDMLLGIDLAIPCGLIVNELVSNALRHAFVDNRSGEVTIGMVQTGSTCRLTVKDNGVGLPEDVDAKSAETLGLQLVETLVDQIDGRSEINNSNGLEYTVVFTIREQHPSGDRIG